MSFRLPHLNSAHALLCAALLTPAVSIAQNTPLNPALPTLFIVGDSTARNQADLGWGDHLAPYFNTTKINIANRAVAGRSSRSFYNEGLWANVLAEIKPGDFVFLQMGHNDGETTTPEADTRARASYQGIGDENVQYPLPKPFTSGPLAGQKTETIHTYGWYIRKYIADTRAKKPRQSSSPSPSATSGSTTPTATCASNATWDSATTKTSSLRNSRFPSSTWRQ